MTGSCAALIIGSIEDPHVNAVIRRMPREGTVVVDAESIPEVLISVGLDGSIFADLTGEPVSIGPGTSTKGWVRRVSPAGWDEGVVVGSRQSAVLLARLGTMGAITRDRYVDWLSTVDNVIASENKLLQYRAALELGIDVPPTIIGGTAVGITSVVGQDFILKPIGPGSYNDPSLGSAVVYAQKVTEMELESSNLLAAPFIAQSRIDAKLHFRVVTVQDRAWVARLNADTLPLDWRSSEEAHRSFEFTHEPDLEQSAVTLSQSMSMGYSSQDWVRTLDGDFFLDLNPGGQWMFLPNKINDQVAQALCDSLTKGH